MKPAFVVVGAHVLLVTACWLTVQILSALNCGLCNPIEFLASIVFILLILPGLKSFGMLIPYSINETASVSFAREAVSLITTEAALFTLVLLLTLLATNLRRHFQS